jgi:hypothetical protein
MDNANALILRNIPSHAKTAPDMDRLYGARLRRLYRDIEALERFAALPLAARAS